MHDYLHILGVSEAAPPDEIRRALRRRRGSHPDFGDPADDPRVTAAAPPPRVHDIAVDFVDMAGIVDRMQAAFFSS